MGPGDKVLQGGPVTVPIVFKMLFDLFSAQPIGSRAVTFHGSRDGWVYVSFPIQPSRARVFDPWLNRN